MMLAAIISLIDRQVLALLIEPVRAEFNISDTEVSFLQGFAFVFLYAGAGVVMGHIADTSNRRRLVIVGLVLWSLMTIWCGLAQSYSELFIARMGVGIGEACLHPAAYSLIADYFRPAHRGRAFAMFSLAGLTGIALSFLGGAGILAIIGDNTHVTLPIVGTLDTWRAVFVIAGLPGFVLAAAMLMMKEPPRQERGSGNGVAGAGSLLKFAASSAKPLGVIVLSFGLATFVGYGVMAWMATAYLRTFDIPLVNAGFLCGAILLISALVGSSSGGVFADLASRSRMVGGKLLVLAYGGMIGGVLMVVWWLIDDIWLSFAVGCVAFIFQAGTTATLPAVLNDITPNELRGKIAAVYLMIVGLAGFALGPTAVALLTDFVFRDPDALRFSLAVISLAVPLGAAVAWAGRKVYADAVAAREAAIASQMVMGPPGAETPAGALS